MKIRISAQHVTIKMTSLEYKGLIDMVATYPSPNHFKDVERFVKAYAKATVVQKSFSELVKKCPSS